MDLDRTTTALLAGLFDPKNAAAWETFDRRYRPILVGFARNSGLRENDAAEVAQETIVRFVEEYRAGRYDRERGRLGAWLVTIARYRILDQRRREGTAKVARGESAMVDLDDERSVTEAYEAERRQAVLREALDELRTSSRTDPKTIKAFEMLVYHGLSTQVVAQELGMSAHDVYLAKSRVAAKLREIVVRLEREFEEGPGDWEASGQRPSASLGS
ncbi:MAG: RNA polymerase sigma factor [Planctomycetota bacterium]|jgi:RNA polymerase sigma factor (sigma-70 family)